MADPVFRIRFIYSKRNRTCFIPHVVIPQIFYRSLRRAGLIPLMSQGFSPRPRITLGPALPVGIVGLEEPAEVWFSHNVECLETIMNSYLPKGLRVDRSVEVEGPSLNKKCESASYLMVPRDGKKVSTLFSAIAQGAPFEESILNCSRLADSIEIVLSNPGGLGPGALIKYFQQKGIIRKWSEICLVRTRVGEWSGSSILSLVR